MPKLNAAHVPDDLWSKFRSDEIDHFEYDTPAVAVYADGHREEFDSSMTPELIAEEREIQRLRDLNDPSIPFQARFHVTVTFDRKNFHPVIVGIAE